MCNMKIYFDMTRTVLHLLSFESIQCISVTISSTKALLYIINCFDKSRIQETIYEAC